MTFLDSHNDIQEETPKIREEAEAKVKDLYDRIVNAESFAEYSPEAHPGVSRIVDHQSPWKKDVINPLTGNVVPYPVAVRVFESEMWGGVIQLVKQDAQMLEGHRMLAQAGAPGLFKTDTIASVNHPDFQAFIDVVEQFIE